jgi:hypothetical protein
VHILVWVLKHTKWSISQCSPGVHPAFCSLVLITRKLHIRYAFSTTRKDRHKKSFPLQGSELLYNKINVTTIPLLPSFRSRIRKMIFNWLWQWEVAYFHASTASKPVNVTIKCKWTYTTSNDRPNLPLLDTWCRCMNLPVATQYTQFYLGHGCGLACDMASLQNGSKIKYGRPTQKFISMAR